MQLAVEYSVVEKGKRAPQYQIGNDLQGEVSIYDLLEHMKGALISITMDVVREEQGQGFDKEPVLIVDNKRNRQITDVSPFGKIEVHARMDTDLTLPALYAALVDASPRYTGQYADHHIVIVNGAEIARNKIQLEQWLVSHELKDQDIVRFVNAMPYAGFLERQGVTSSGSSIKMEKSTDKRRRAANSEGMVRRPNGVYFLTWRAFKRKYKGTSFISFDWMPGNALGLTKRVPSRTGQDMRVDFSKSNRKYRGFYVYPTITLRIRGEGIK